ncbi:MAG: hypothetical protein ACOCZM_00880 [Bacillota bacterium]
MLKKAAVIIIVLIFAAIAAGCSGDELGPSWDTTFQLPAAEEEGDIAELTGADDFEEFGYKIVDNQDNEEEIEVFIVGDETNPISRKMDFSLPELSIDMGEPLFTISKDEIPLDDGEHTITESIDLEPEIEFGSSISGYNSISVAVDVAEGYSQLDTLEVKVLDSATGEVLDTGELSSSVEPGGSEEVVLDLSGDKIEGELEFEVSIDQESGPTLIDLSILGPDQLNVKKVDGLDPESVGGDIEFEEEFDIGSNISDMENITISDHEDTPARLDVGLDLPDFNGVEFKFDSIYLDEQPFEEDPDEKYSYYLEDDVSLGNIGIEGGLELVDGESLTYDASENIGAKAGLQGRISFDNPFGSSDIDYTVEDGVVKFWTQPLEVDISSSELDKMLKESIQEEDSYLYVEFDSDIESEVRGQFYFGDTEDSDQLYTDENEVISVDTRELKDGKKIVIGEHIQDFKEQLENAPVYLGARFQIGTDGVDEYTFNINDSYYLNSYLGVVMKMN